MNFTLEKLKEARNAGISDDIIWQTAIEGDERFSTLKKENVPLDIAFQAYQESLSEKEPERRSGGGIAGGAADIGIQFAKGLGAGTRMISDVFGASNPVSQAIAGYEDYMDSLLSAESKQDSQEISRILKDAEGKGILPQVMAGLEAFTVAPAEMTASTVGMMLPNLAGGVYSKAAQLTKAGVLGLQMGIGAAQGIGSIKGQIYSAVQDELRNQGLPEDQIETVATEAQAYGGKNLDQILIGGGLGALAASTGAEKIMTRLITGAGKEATEDFIKAAIKGGLSEMPLEGLQGGQEKIAENVALQRIGVDVPTMQGVIPSAAMEATAGLLIGGAAGGIEAIVSPEKNEETDINKKANQTANELLAPNDTASQSVVKELSRRENAVQNLRQAYDALEPTSQEAQKLKLELSDSQKKLSQFKEVANNAGLSLPITEVEQQQIDLAKQIAAPAPETPAAPVEVAPAVEPAPVQPAAVEPAPAVEAAPVESVTTPTEEIPVTPAVSETIIPTEEVTTPITEQEPIKREQMLKERENRFLSESVVIGKNDPRFSRSQEVSAGVGGIVNKVEQANLSEIVSEPSVYHESNLDNIRKIVKTISSNLRRVDLWASNSLDLALGQGGTGYIIELDTKKVNGSIAKTLAAQIQQELGKAETEIKINKTTPSSIKSITAPNNSGLNALRKTPGLEKLFDFDNAIQTERGIRIPVKQAAPAVTEEVSAPTEAVAPAPEAVPTGIAEQVPVNRQAEYSVAAAKAPWANDLQNKPTGWKFVESPDGATLVSIDGSKIVRFESQDKRSGTEALRKKTEAQAWAMDNPLSLGDTIIPSEGISVGNRIKLGKSPQTYIVEEVMPQSASEKELGEQYYSVKNERTGETQVVEEKDLKKVGGKRVRKMASELRVEEEYTPVPEKDRYTFEQAVKKVDSYFEKQGIPEGVVIVNNTTDPDLVMKAGYFLDRGQIIINLAYIERGENIGDIITHELGHYIYSEPEFQAAFKNFYNSLPADARAEIDEIVNEGYNKETNEVQLEEKQVVAFAALVKKYKESRTAWEVVKDTIKKIINKLLKTNMTLSDQGAMAVLNVAYKRFKSGERIIREMETGVLKMAAEPKKMERYEGRAQVAGIPSIGAKKDTPKAINAKTEAIIRERVFDASIVNDNQTKKALNLIGRLEESNPDSGKNAQAINELTRETMQDVEADDVVKQSIGAVKLRNELYSYAIKLAGEGDKSMLDRLLNTRLSIGSGSIVEGDAGRLLQAMASLKSWIVRATEAEQTGFFGMAAQQFFGTKNPTEDQINKIKDIFNKVKKVKIDQEQELMTEIEEVGKAAGVDLPAAIEKQLENAPMLDPMVAAMTAMQKLYGGTITTKYEQISKKAEKIKEGVKRILQGGLPNYRQKIVSKAANGLETGFWKTLSDTENKPGPLGELDAAQNRALGNIVKQSLVAMGLKGTPPNTKMSIYEQVSSMLNEKPLSQDKIKMADQNVRATIESKRQSELDNATEDQQDAINLKYDGILLAWDEAMSRSLDMPVSDTMIRRMILNELKDTDTSIQEIANLMDEEPAIGTSRQDRLVNSIIEKVTGVTFEGQPTRDYTELKTYLSNMLENMVIAKQEKNKVGKGIAKVKRDASGNPDKQAQAQIDKLAKIQADPTIFGEKKTDPVRQVVSDALALKLNMGFTPGQTAEIKRNWKGAYVADPNRKGIPTSFMLEMQRLGVNESAANTLAEIVWRQIEVNAMSRQIDATNKAVEAGPIGGIVQAILDTPLSEQQDPEWRKKVIVDYLKNAGIKPSQAENIAKLFDVSLRKRFAKAQEEAALKAAKSIEGGMDTNSKRAFEKFLKAIRAQVLDPGKDVAKAFAESMGWQGFTTDQIVKINELDTIVNDDTRTNAEKAVAVEQIQQIIDKVSLPPQIKEVLSSFYVGNALMRFTTFSVQAFDPLAITTFNTAIESLRNITNPRQFMQTWADYGRAISNLVRETAFSYKNDTMRSGRMIEYLENEDRKVKRLWDEAEKKWNRGDYRGAMKDGLFGYTSYTFRILKALDDGAYSLLTSTTLPQYTEAALKAAKIPRDKRRAVMRQILEAREMDIKTMVADGISKNDAVIYANERMQGAITKELSGLNIDAQEVINSAINDSLARIGKTRVAEDILSGKTEEIKDLGFLSSPFLRWYETASRAVNQGGSETQKIFYRVLMGFPLIPARIFNIVAGYTPLTIYRHALKNRYSLTYGTALQRKQRLAEQLAGTMVMLPLLALRSNSLEDDDEKEKGMAIYITGQGPSKLKDKTLHAKWNDKHDPFSLELRVNGKTSYKLDAKAAGPLSVIIYMLGALDDFQINRKLDDMKTTKDDWKEAEDKASILTALYEYAGYATLTTARRGPTTGVLQGLVDFRRFPEDPIAAIGAEVSFSAMPAVPVLGAGVVKNLSDFFSQPIDNTTKEGALLANIPIVGPIAGKPALNSYGQRIGELRVSEKLKKSFGIPFTVVTSDSDDDNKLTSLTLKNGNGPTPITRADVENALRSAITDEEWYLAAKTFGDRNKKFVLQNYEKYDALNPTAFGNVISGLAKASKATAIKAVIDQRNKNP